MKTHSSPPGYSHLHRYAHMHFYADRLHVNGQTDVHVQGRTEAPALPMNDQEVGASTGSGTAVATKAKAFTS